MFIPNYRGTSSYGKPDCDVRDMAGEPADDIVSGIAFLVERGGVDPNRIGILSQFTGLGSAPSS